MVSTSSYSQLYLLVDPALRREGILYRQDITESWGMYARCQYLYVDMDNYLHWQSIKSGIGATYTLKSINAYLFLGLNHNYNYDIIADPAIFNLSNLHEISIDIGISPTKNERFKLLIITDLLNMETSIGLSFRFNKRKYERDKRLRQADSELL